MALTFITDKTLAKQLMERSMAAIHLTSSTTYHPSFEDWKTLGVFNKSILGDHIQRAFGDAPLQVNGKYKKAQLYYFECDGQYVSCVVEGKGKGTSWGWVLPAHELHRDGRVLFFDDPILNPWFSRMLCEMHQLMLNTPLPPTVFDPDIQILLKAQDDQQALQSVVGDVGELARPHKM